MRYARRRIMAAPRTTNRRSAAAWFTPLAPVGVGKFVGGARYLHLSALDEAARAALMARVAEAGAPVEGFNVLKVAADGASVTLLDYAGFFDAPFPCLARAWTVDLAAKRCELRSYDAEGNPPILHRKELLLALDDPRRDAFAKLTADAERHGLFADAHRIGHRAQWDERLRAAGLVLNGHTLVRMNSDGSDAIPEGTVAAPTTREDVASEAVFRHRTAMARRALSTPMQALWRHGFLGEGATLFDYGCGRGDDLATLAAQGLDARGWDPHFRPEAPRTESDVVNLGFVLNVIEDPSERRLALTSAYALARRVLAVSAIMGGRTELERHRAFGDGVLTSRNTFQKYFAHEELGAYVADALGREPVSVGPGLFFVFRRDEDEQDFLERRQRSTGLATPSHTPAERVRAVRAERPVRAPRPAPPNRWTQHADLADALWQSCLALGRAPRDGEFARLVEVTEHLGAVPTVLRHLVRDRGDALLAQARARRMGDLAVFLAMNLFERRRSAQSLGDRARTDVREFWGSLAKAMEAAQALLFSLRDAATLERACAEAAAAGLGWHRPGDALWADARLVPELPPALRAYLGCAGKLYDTAEADVVKLHVASGKVSLLRYDDWTGAAVPRLRERVKIDLRRRRVDVFEYGGTYVAEPLWQKSRYLHPALEGYAAQREFDEALRERGIVGDEGAGPREEEARGVVAEVAGVVGVRAWAEAGEDTKR